MDNIATIFITFTFLGSFSHAIVMDFCVGDLSLPRTPAGYACKDPSKATTDDFVYTGFRDGEPTSESSVFNNSVTFATAEEFPGLNGMGISMGRLDLDVGGVIPLHTHRTSEVIIIAKGEIIAGFIDNNNTAYYKTLQVGDVMIFPPSLLHFQVNSGETPALAFVSLNSANPGLQIVDESLFGGNQPSELVEKTMLLDPDQVKKLKMIFGGTNHMSASI